MAAAQMALAIEMSNRVKRKTQAIGVFLNMETQRKFLKTASNAELQQRLESQDSIIGIMHKQACDRAIAFDRMREECESRDVEGLLEEVTELRYKNEYLQDMLSKSWRPGHKYINWCQDGFQGMNKHTDNFLMEFENSCVTDFNSKYPGQQRPTGPERYKNKQWATIIKEQVYPHHSDVDWNEYQHWVRQGGGDEWFIEP